MGTRNLTAVMIGGEYKIAQYGQWDGYPEGQGATALAFCHARLATPEGRAMFADALKRVRWAHNDDEIDALWKESSRNRAFLTRDAGAKILTLVADAKDNVVLHNSIDFAADSLFCEWAYVIDLDRLTFEVYNGFAKTRTAAQRFSEAKSVKEATDGYCPITHAFTWPLDALPTEEAFLEHFQSDVEDDGE